MNVRKMRAPRPWVIAAVAVCVVAGLFGPVTSASANNGFAESLQSLTLSGGEAAPTGSNAPDLLIVSGTSDVTVTVTAQGPDTNGVNVVQPVRQKSDFTLSVTSRSGKTVLSKTSVTILQGESTGSVTLRLTGEANGVVITAKGSGSQKTWTASNSDAPVDVALKAAPLGPSTATLWGTAGAAPCAPDNTVGNRVCADLVTPRGASSSVLFTTGLCDAVVGCDPKTKDLVQVLVNLGTTYPRDNPATLIVKCDKLSCPGGGVSTYNVLFSTAPTGPLSPAPACLDKGVVNPTGPSYCVDYVQSKRDNAGDTLLYLLFTEDARGSM